MLVALVMGALMLPRGVRPVELPLPRVDARVLTQVESADDARAARAHRVPLSPQVRELGSAVRDFNVHQARGVEAFEAGKVRTAIETLVPPLLADPEALLSLRAVQMDEFLSEVHRFEATGTPSPELDALGGSFLRSMEQVGWVSEHRVLLDDSSLRVAFKLSWNGVVGVTARPEFAPSLDETRALYTFYLQNPHPSEQASALFESALRGAHDRKACDALLAGRALAAERWRLEKIERLGAVDATYPLAYARGIAQFHLERYGDAARSFEAYLAANPEGPYALRAKNYLKAALELGS